MLLKNFSEKFSLSQKRESSLYALARNVYGMKNAFYITVHVREGNLIPVKKMIKVLKTPSQAGSERKSEPRLIKDIMNEMIRTSDEPIARVLRQLNLQQP